MGLEGISSLLNQTGIAKEMLQGSSVVGDFKNLQSEALKKNSKIDFGPQTSETQGASGLHEMEFRHAGGMGTAPTFGEIIGQMINQVDAKDKAYQNELNAVLTGRSDNIHSALMHSKEAKLYLSLATKVREELVGGFKEIMRMQV